MTPMTPPPTSLQRKPPISHFHHCPRCGAPYQHRAREPVLRCAHCAFTYYFNPAVAVAAFLEAPEGRWLFVRRAKEPARGKLALPGGFVDYDETAERALHREIREEVGLTVGALHFLCSQTNHYDYRDVSYPVVDLFFTASTDPRQQAEALDGVAAIHWLTLSEIVDDELAFPSIRRAVGLLRQLRRGTNTAR